MTIIIIVGAALVAVVAAIWWLRHDFSESKSYSHTGYDRLREGFQLSPLTEYGRRRRAHAKACPDTYTSPVTGDVFTCYQFDRRHRPCDECGTLTPGMQMVINAETLRRQRRPQCSECQFAGYRREYRHGETSEQKELRQKRARADWERPIPDQYPGPARSFVRDFLESGDEERILTATDPDVVTVNGTLGVLGLENEAYAEQRSNLTVVRRIRR